jgi:hypothetical protein
LVRRIRRLHRAGQRVERRQAAGLLELELQEGGNVGDALAQAAEVLKFA